MHKTKFEVFLPLETNSYGIYGSFVPYEDQSITVVSFSHALAPHETLKDAFLGDMMKNPKSIASTLYDYKKLKTDWIVT